MATPRLQAEARVSSPGVPWQPQILADQLTLSQPWTQTMPIILLLAPSDFQTFQQPCKRQQDVFDGNSGFLCSFKDTSCSYFLVGLHFNSFYNLLKWDFGRAYIIILVLKEWDRRNVKWTNK
jgi:hypothetical protein